MNNDLISRSALRQEVFFHTYLTKVLDSESKVLNEVLRLIDNAPTVDTDLSKYSDKLWKEAYERGKDERPQGEWIKKVDNVGFVSYICSECGSEIEVEDCSDDKFCFNCGAKMKEADNEQ